MFPELEKQFLEYVDVQESDIAVKDSLAQILTWAEEYIYSTYYVSIIPRTVTENLDGSGTPKLYTSRGNINAITSLTISGEVVSTSLLKTNKNIVVYGASTFISGTLNIDITYSIGYNTYDLVPSGLVNALFVIGRKMYTDATKNFDGISLIQSDTKQSIKPLDTIPYLAENILQAYRIFKF
jgi:hypothetical protein